jgi:hypothetical protein
MLDMAIVKAHLRVDGDDDDALIQAYVDAAFSAFTVWTNRTLVDPGDALPDPVGSAMLPTKAVEQGALLLVGHWYANRESAVVGVTAAELPQSTNALWRPYRWVNV